MHWPQNAVWIPLSENRGAYDALYSNPEQWSLHVLATPVGHVPHECHRLEERKRRRFLFIAKGCVLDHKSNKMFAIAAARHHYITLVHHFPLVGPRR